jgi:hypothetical protein
MPTDCAPRGKDLLVLAVLIHAHDAADTCAVVEIELLLGRHVEGLAEGDIDLSVGADTADAGGVVVALLRGRDEIALLQNLECCDVGPLVEKLRRRKLKDPVLLGHVKHAVRREADTIREVEGQGGCEHLHLVGNAILVPIRDGVDVLLAGTDEDDSGIRPHGHVACIRHEGVELDLEALRQLDALQIAAKRVGLAPLLWNGLRLLGARALEVAQTLEIAGGRLNGRLGERRHRQGSRRHGSQQQTLHGSSAVTPGSLGSWIVKLSAVSSTSRAPTRSSSALGHMHARRTGAAISASVPHASARAADRRSQKLKSLRSRPDEWFAGSDVALHRRPPRLPLDCADRPPQSCRESA